jgi:hypothetical protein
MTRIEFYGFGDQVNITIGWVRDLILSKPYIDTSRICLVAVPCISTDFHGQDKPFIRVVSHLERNREIASLIARELQLEVEFIIVSANFP